MHLNKSRVDLDHKHPILIVQPRRTRQRKDQPGLVTDSSQIRNQSPEFNRTLLDSFYLNCAAAVSHGSPAGASSSLAESENSQSFSFNPLYCIPHRRRCSLEDVATIRPSCFCPAGFTDRPAAGVTRTGSDEAARFPASYPTSRQRVADGEASAIAVACRSFVSRRTRSHLHEEPLHSVERGEPSPESTGVHEEVADSALSLGRGSISDSVGEPDGEVLVLTVNLNDLRYFNKSK